MDNFSPLTPSPSLAPVERKYFLDKDGVELHYIVEKRIASGAFGSVFLAKLPGSGYFAVKETRLTVQTDLDQDFYASIIRKGKEVAEIRKIQERMAVLTQLSHKNVVRYYFNGYRFSSDLEPAYIILTMDYCSGAYRDVHMSESR